MLVVEIALLGYCTRNYPAQTILHMLDIYKVGDDLRLPQEPYERYSRHLLIL